MFELVENGGMEWSGIECGYIVWFCIKGIEWTGV